MEIFFFIFFGFMVNVFFFIVSKTIPRNFILIKAICEFGREAFEFSFYIRTIQEADLILALFVGIQVSGSNYKFLWNAVSTILSYLLLPIFFVYPLILYRFLLWVKKHIDGNDKKIEGKYGSAMENYVNIGNIPVITAVVHSTRRVMISMVITLFNGYLIISGLSLLIISMSTAVFFTIVRPYNSMVMNIVGITSEFMMIVLDLFIMMIIMLQNYEFKLTTEDQLSFGVYLLVWMNIMLVFHIAAILLDTIVNIKKIWGVMKKSFQVNVLRLKLLLKGELANHLYQIKEGENPEDLLAKDIAIAKSRKENREDTIEGLDVEMVKHGESVLTDSQINLFINSRMM